MKNKALFFSLLCAAFVSCSQTPKSPYEVPVSEADEPMMTGKFEPITRCLNGTVTRSLVFGHIGDRNVWKVQVTGWLARCIWKAHMCISIM